MLDMLEKFSEILGEDVSFWFILIFMIFVLSGILAIMYRTPEWRAKETKDENGNTVTEYFRL